MSYKDGTNRMMINLLDSHDIAKRVVVTFVPGGLISVHKVPVVILTASPVLYHVLKQHVNKDDIVVPNKQFEGRVFYQIFPERFARGADKSNTEYILSPYTKYQS